MADTIRAVRFRQWLEEWDHFEFDPKQFRRKPEPFAYLFTLPAVQLRRLSGVYRRQRTEAEATGLQRAHDERRSQVIREYVKYGYPYGGLRPDLRTTEAETLKKPGWLPTAIVINILLPNDVRRGRKVAAHDLIKVTGQGGRAATYEVIRCIRASIEHIGKQRRSRSRDIPEHCRIERSKWY